MDNLESIRQKLYDSIEKDSKEDILKLSHELDKYILDVMKQKQPQKTENSKNSPRIND